MARKIAGASALIVFAVSLLLGLDAQNTFTTTLSRALIAMAATFAVGLIIGAMAEKMMQEHVATEKKIGKSTENPNTGDR